MFCLNLMRIALELAKENPVYEGLATKFFQHYVYVARGHEAHGQPRLPALGRARTASSTTCCATPTAASSKFRVRSLVGLIPLFAVERLEDDWIEPFPEFTANLALVPRATGRDLVAGRRAHRRARRRARRTCCTIVNEEQLRAAAASACCDPDEFLSPYGLRSLSKAPRASTRSCFDGQRGAATSRPRRCRRSRAATRTGAGRSGSRPRFLLIESLRKLGKAFGADFTVPTCRRATASR